MPPNWRRKLSNFDPSPVTLDDGRTFWTAEHAFQAQKCKHSTRPDLAASFEIDGTIGKNPVDAKRAGSRAVFASQGANLDVARWEAARDSCMEEVIRARLRCDPEFEKILLTAGSLKLTLLHFERSAARSYWGGAIDKRTGNIVGRNRLGEMLMDTYRQL